MSLKEHAMKGDFTRSTFKPENHYDGVRLQQGRVLLDADFNEQLEIAAHLRESTARDIIGLCGAPRDNAGFEIGVTSDGADLTISQGRIYVDGILCEAEDSPTPITYSSQPDYPSPEPALDGEPPPAAGTYLAYLDVWKHHITALEEPSIREVALGGPDTTTRTKTVCQVKLIRMGETGDESLNCSSEFADWQVATSPSTGLLAARAEPGEKAADPCVIPARAGYRGLENQLYRVEIQKIISADEISIKWSRENGSVVFPWIDQDTLDPNKLTLSSTGRDEVLGVAADDWVELTDDQRDLHGVPGILVQVVDVDDKVVTVDPGTETIIMADFPLHPKVRRWDMPGDVGEITVDLTILDNWLELESGIQVKFEPGVYRSGDYWLIPARTATGDIEWPRDASDGEPVPRPPHGIYHHYCRLALLHFEGGVWTIVNDCRELFPPLTEMIRLFPVSGDGQEAMPGRPVPRPVQVGVANGQWPVQGARVRFEVAGGNGRLGAAGASPCTNFAAGGSSSVDVETGADGIAGCCWRLDGVTLSQQVEATVQEIDGKPMVDATGNPLITPIRFNANLSVAGQVAYDPALCPNLSGVTTVKEAIDVLCRTRPGCCVTVGQNGDYETLDQAITVLLQQGQRDICICLMPGDHVLPGLELSVPVEDPELHIKIVGCGLGSRVFLEKPARFTGVNAIALENAAFELRFVAKGEQGAIAFDHCTEVGITSCHFSGFTLFDGTQPSGYNDAQPLGALLSITNAHRVLLRSNVFEAASVTKADRAALLGSLDLPRAVFEKTGAVFLAKLFGLPSRGVLESREFERGALDAALALAALKLEERKKLRDEISAALSGFTSMLSEGEIFSYQMLMLALGIEKPALDDLYDTLLNIRRASIKSRPGVAVIIGAELDMEKLEDIEVFIVAPDDTTTVECNEIIGILSLCGMPPAIDIVRKALSPNVLEGLQKSLKSGGVSLRERGALGTLQLRGNQLVRIAVAKYIIERVAKLAELQKDQQVLAFGLFQRCLISDNVIEGGDNWVVCVHQPMTGNDFTMMAAHLQDQIGPVEIGFVIADTAIYVANHSSDHDPDWVLRDISRKRSKAANLEITIK
jgi:hypothetical protein